MKVLLLLAAGMVVGAQTETKFGPRTKGLVLGDVEQTEFRSRFTGQTYRVLVALPEGYAEGNKRYPVLYVPDADFTFESARIAVATLGLGRKLRMGRGVEELILVGVPLKAEDAWDWARRRTIDLTPSADEKTNGSLGKQLGGPVGSGGASQFLRALTEEVAPWVEANYRTVPGDRGLAGYSLGGLFTFWVMLQEQRAFTRFLVGSPSLWWGGGEMLKAEEAFAEAGKQLRGRAYFSVGSVEGRTMVTPLEQLVKKLAGRGYGDFRFESRIVEGADHFSGIAGTFSAGVKFLYGVEPVGR